MKFFDNVFNKVFCKHWFIKWILTCDNLKYEIKTILNIDAIDYSFINENLTQIFCKIFNIKSQKFNRHKIVVDVFDDIQRIIHVIYFRFIVKNHIELIIFVFIIRFFDNFFILNLSWIKKHDVVLNDKHKFIKFIFDRCDHKKTFQIRKNRKSSRFSFSQSLYFVDESKIETK